MSHLTRDLGTTLRRPCDDLAEGVPRLFTWSKSSLQRHVGQWHLSATLGAPAYPFIFLWSTRYSSREETDSLQTALIPGVSKRPTCRRYCSDDASPYLR